MFGEKLKTLRQRLMYTQSAMADNLNISARTYASYEREENNPPYSMLLVLCEKYDVNLNWFIADKGEMFNAPQFEQAQEEFALKVRQILKDEGLIK